MQDQFQRNIHYLRVSLTDRCNLRCQYCMPEQGVEKKQHQDMLSAEEFFTVIKAAVSLGIDKIRFTGGEPLLYKGLLPLAQKVGNLEGIRDIALTTNALLLPEMAKDLFSAGIRRLNISLDTLDPQKYRELTRGGELSQALAGIEAARNAGFEKIKINTVLMKGWNDNEVRELAGLVTQGLAEELRFIELMPIGDTATWAQEYYRSTDDIIEELKLKPLEAKPGSAAQMFCMPTGEKIGLIHPVSHKFCGDCNRIRLTADGKLKTCLLQNEEHDLREALHQGTLRAALERIIFEKPLGHSLEAPGGIPDQRGMGATGG